MKAKRLLFLLAGVAALGSACHAARNFPASPLRGGWVSMGSMTAMPQTLVLWVRPSVTNSTKALLTTTGAANHYQLAGLSSGLNRWYAASRAGGAESYAASSTPPALNQWTHIAAVFVSATSRQIWVNGSLEGSNTTSVTPTLTAATLGIRCDGAFPNTTAPSNFEGDLAFAALYGVALTAAEIGQLAGMGNPGKAVHPSKIRPQSLVAEWSLDGATAYERNSSGLPLFLTNLPAQASSPTIIR